MANLLLIISKDYPERYEFLKKAFASRKEVEVVLDRRAGQPPPRPQDRRAHQTDTQLRSHGWVLVRRLPGAAKTTAPQVKAGSVTPAASAAKSPAPQAKTAAPRAGRAATKAKPAASKRSVAPRQRRARA